MLGELLAARYRVINVLRSGGFGQTYIAEDTQRPGHPRCVLKHLTFNSNDSTILQQVRRLFQAEAETLERLGRHDQIPRLLAYFEINREFYLVQEFIDGQPLSDELADGRRFSEAEVMALLRDVLGVLEFVHAQQVIHRDIKPDNLIRRRQDGKLVLIDFGAVKAIGNTIAESTGETTLSVPIYTSGYGASEQCMGSPRYSSDLYSLGIVAVQALTGLRPAQLPQDFHTGEIIWRDQAQVHDRLAAVLDKLISFHFTYRYQTATEVLQALDGLTEPSQVPDQVPNQDHDRSHDQSRDQRRARLRRPGPHTVVQAETQSTNATVTRFRPLSWQWWAGLGLGAVAIVAAFAIHQVVRPDRPGPTPITTGPTAGLVDTHISTGERLLSSWQTNADTANADKQEGVAQIAAGNFSRAIPALEAARQRDRSDPETLIYLNNARIGSGRSYTIAAVVPVANAYGSAQEILRGVAQAQDAVNRAGGMNGVPLRVAIADDENQPAIATQLAAELAARPEILGVVGHSISDTTIAAAKVYQERQLPMVSPLSSAVQLSSFGSYVFRTMPSDQLTAKALAGYMLNQLKQSKVVVLFNSASAYSRSLKQEFKAALFYNGVEVMDEVDLSRPDFDAFEVVTRAIAKGAQVMMLAADFTTSDRALQALQVNHRRLKVLAGDSFFIPKLVKVGGADAIGTVLAVPADLTRSPFRQAVRNVWGPNVMAGWRTALAYDAAQALIEALRRDPSRSGIQRVMLQPTFRAVGAEGPVSFLATGDRKSPVSLMTVAEVKQGKETTIEFQSLP